VAAAKRIPATTRYLAVPLILLVTYGVSSFDTPAPNTAQNEIIRLGLHILMAFSVIWAVRTFDTSD